MAGREFGNGSIPVEMCVRVRSILRGSGIPNSQRFRCETARASVPSHCKCTRPISLLPTKLYGPREIFGRLERIGRRSAIPEGFVSTDREATMTLNSNPAGCG